ncbi:MAG: 30S ribosomal protein S3 [Planctomycetota bacterium]
MGQKTSPTGYRLGIPDREPWRSRWYASKKEFGRFLVEDQKIRRYIKTGYRSAAVSRIDIERTRETITVIIHTGRPGILIGRKGSRVDQLRADLERIAGRHVGIRTVEVPKPELSAQLVSESVGEQLEKRVSFRRALKKTAQLTMQAGALGVKIHIAGRLGGAEMARRESVILGSIPLATIDANVDYGFSEARTTYGAIGIKVWVYNGMYSKVRKTDGADAQA